MNPPSLYLPCEASGYVKESSSFTVAGAATEFHRISYYPKNLGTQIHILLFMNIICVVVCLVNVKGLQTLN